jgi:hypothetical protein
MTTPIILTPQMLLPKLQALPPEQLQQVLDFVDFLTQRYGHSATDSTQPKSPRVLGLYEGKGWMSEDFDSPLPDEFWLGQS